MFNELKVGAAESSLASSQPNSKGTISGASVAAAVAVSAAVVRLLPRQLDVTKRSKKVQKA